MASGPAQLECTAKVTANALRDNEALSAALQCICKYVLDSRAADDAQFGCAVADLPTHLQKQLCEELLRKAAPEDALACAPAPLAPQVQRLVADSVAQCERASHQHWSLM